MMPNAKYKYYCISFVGAIKFNPLQSIANSSRHWGSYGSIWTGPSPKKYYMDRSIFVFFFKYIGNYQKCRVADISINGRNLHQCHLYLLIVYWISASNYTYFLTLSHIPVLCSDRQIHGSYFIVQHYTNWCHIYCLTYYTNI